MRWSVQEEWVLFILHKTVNNRWAEITNILLGRSDNSIKNYWNSTLSQKQGEFERDLKNYMKITAPTEKASAASTERSFAFPKSAEDDDEQNIKQQVLHNVLQQYIRAAQAQYLDYIREKISELHLEAELDE
mmetsp:Transcript_46978/g.62178  ORF Transcript_46978/g.62178 Transcript_46978/m.62178 type:complete len:132 (+) Transcript_46978:491-886(+)|eukprot:CAMPEP_0185572974 /NCGR_PEP_ID=MMETSP0434-20130131/4806_1 /TAXON_ID=626734 ORGANISM="Favella taraikaensis, Strain Fe Narragansett Bay" /NCGR_SAMPLE_ID=MMETSP0434 /ASSEMBLY_ACC=CAM_ASM_000379 /LENGTH=131 /DNA_ID=CAMNT_0028189059 /DNA_START=482 /DNA_END=877 /DNA_ORIENTATION=+